MPLLKRVRVFAAAIETTPGTAESLAAGDGVFNAYETSIQAEIEVEEREAQGAFNRLSGVAGPRKGKVTFKTDVGVGLTTQPTWASILLPACGWVDSSDTYTPRSEAIGSNVKTVTIGVYENGMLKVLAGAMGTFKLVCPAGKMAMMEWEFSGVWQAPTTTAIIAPTYPTALPIRFASASTTFDSVALQVENVTIDAGNEVIYREDPTTAGGYISALVTDRKPTITCSPESVLAATQDRFAQWLASTEAAFAFTMNGASSASVAVSAPKAQITNLQEADRNKLQVDDIEFSCNKNGVTNDQELSITVTAGA